MREKGEEERRIFRRGVDSLARGGRILIDTRYTRVCVIRTRNNCRHRGESDELEDIRPQFWSDGRGPTLVVTRFFINHLHGTTV